MCLSLPPSLPLALSYSRAITSYECAVTCYGPVRWSAAVAGPLLSSIYKPSSPRPPLVHRHAHFKSFVYKNALFCIITFLAVMGYFTLPKYVPTVTCFSLAVTG